jgi:hypothetical protein
MNNFITKTWVLDKSSKMLSSFTDTKDDKYCVAQTVELWVPLRCDKCERKVREHLEDMEGEFVDLLSTPAT